MILGFLLLTLLNGPVAAVLGSPFNPDVTSRSLDSMIPEAWPGEEMEVIIQFRGECSRRDLALLEGLGFDVLHKYSVLPAVHARGTALMVKKLSMNDRIFFIEPNREIEQDMELSTKVINATRAWTTKIEDLFPTDPYISGEGVSAVIVDTGIDAGHPDLDYGEKTIINLYLETENNNWKESENTDLYYGHGTHVAGTVAGNGDASAGARRGVAPGASLIGVTVWDPTMADYLVGEEWVYEHSRPNANPYNIRVATNSWHTIEDEYENESALSQIIMKLAHDNNVVTTWSAGNEGRTDPEGTTVTTSIEGNTPVAIMVAAYERDGSAVTDFSSRGEIGKPQTYPDIGAPGRSIWSTSARRTVISSGTYVGGNTNPYYLAISGTSMSTPHVCGLVSLLFQAAPSLKISDRHEDFNGTEEEIDAWMKNPYTRVHEIEWIMEATATYLPPSDATGVFADDPATGADGQPIDYAQGYGIVNAEYAVGVALTLEKLRKANPGVEVTVQHALDAYNRGVMVHNVTEARTDTLYTQWFGEFSRYNDQFNKPMSAVNQTKFVFVPENASKAVIDLTYTPVNLQDRRFGDITFTVDYGGDGSVDYTGPLSPYFQGSKHAEIDIDSSRTGDYWVFGIIGEGFRFHLAGGDINYVELRIEFSMAVQLIFSMGAGYADATAFNATGAMVAPLYIGEPTPEYTEGTLLVNTDYYLLSKASLVPEEKKRKPGVGEFPWGILALVIIVTIIFVALLKRKRKL
jgi:serine protease AprX